MTRTAKNSRVCRVKLHLMSRYTSPVRSSVTTIVRELEQLQIVISYLRYEQEHTKEKSEGIPQITVVPNCLKNKRLYGKQGFLGKEKPSTYWCNQLIGQAETNLCGTATGFQLSRTGKKMQKCLCIFYFCCCCCFLWQVFNTIMKLHC